MGRTKHGWAVAGLFVATGCYSGLDAIGERPDGVSLPDDDDDDASDDADDDDDDGSTSSCNPAAVRASTLSRLNRREYLNTVTDLLALTEPLAIELPHDEPNIAGLDNDGAHLGVLPGDAEIYYEAATGIAARLDTDGARPLAACGGQTGAALHECAAAELPGFLARAFRGPVPASVPAAFLELAEPDTSYEELVDTVVVATLMSPHFIFHYKTPVGDSDRIDGWELADRLAYLLWSSMPDDALLATAADGSLLEPEVRAEQIARMRADSRAERFHRDFASIWLQLPRMDDKDTIDDALAESMQQESQRMVRTVVDDGAPLTELLTSSTMPVDGRLAEHYGLDLQLPDGQWQPIVFPATERAGLLTASAPLTIPNESDVTDPIRRGVWVADRILCTPPPKPPADVDIPEFDGDKPPPRELLEQHREPACAGCHAQIDPFGLALEQYDAVGRFRATYDDGSTIDASGEYIEEPFDDAVELANVIADSGRFEVCFGYFVSSYALGRSLEPSEACYVREFAETLTASDAATFDGMLAALVASDLFDHRGATQ